jgi:hypothetical protein
MFDKVFTMYCYMAGKGPRIDVQALVDTLVPKRLAPIAFWRRLGYVFSGFYEVDALRLCRGSDRLSRLVELHFVVLPVCAENRF